MAQQVYIGVFVQGPCLDLTRPTLEVGVKCIPEHLFWEALPEQAISALAAPSKGSSSSTVHDAQVHTMRSVLGSFSTESHIVEQLASFARCVVRPTHCSAGHAKPCQQMSAWQLAKLLNHIQACAGLELLHLLAAAAWRSLEGGKQLELQ